MRYTTLESKYGWRVMDGARIVHEFTDYPGNRSAKAAAEDHAAWHNRQQAQAIAEQWPQ